MSEIGVMHVLDTLALGGAERAAVNLVNELPRNQYRPYLCSTRTEGPLRDALHADVGFLALRRTSRFDRSAVRRFVNFVRKENIAIVHAHGSSLFFAALAASFSPKPTLVWHAHYGRVALENRWAWAHRLVLRRAAGVITVNRQLADWCARRLAIPSEKVWCIPNMVRMPPANLEMPELPGISGSRIVCVANLREEKDHLTLIRAMAIVVRQCPSARLLLVGAHSDSAYSASATYFQDVKMEVAQYSLQENISFLGQRRDIPNLLRGCDIGVLSSKTEGLPVSLLEYGAAGLAVVATQVGECEEVLDYGSAGIVVPSQSPKELAEALVVLLRSRERRAELGRAFSLRVQGLYSPASIMKQVCHVYDDVLALNRSGGACVSRVQDGVQA